MSARGPPALQKSMKTRPRKWALPKLGGFRKWVSEVLSAVLSAAAYVHLKSRAGMKRVRAPAPGCKAFHNRRREKRTDSATDLGDGFFEEVVVQEEKGDGSSVSAMEMVHEDIAQRTLEESPLADIYCVGPPCQPLSRNGRRQGSEDEQGRGILALRGIAYISHRRPRLVLLEQVPDFLTDEKVSDVRDFILGTLEEFYTLSIKILASSDYGVPQARRRVYVVAARKDLAGYGGFQFPEPVPCPRLENFITRLGPTEFQMLPSQEIGGGRTRETGHQHF